MKKYFDVLRKCSLFQSIADQDLTGMLDCLGTKVVGFSPKETILSEGEAVKYIGIVLSGSAQIVRIDYFGNRSIVASLLPSELFGESFACAGVAAMPVNVVASEAAEIMLIDHVRITQPCSDACPFHRQMIDNLLRIVAEKNLAFHQKIEITSKRTTREKLLAYLLLQAKKTNGSCFEIPYDRQELADYLGVDRSGLSVEIGKLRREGVIDCRRSRFELLRPFEV